MKKFLALLLIGGLIFQPAVYPASYPSAIKSFTTKVDNVDDVEAEHINSLQDEVVAIQTALGAGLSNPVVQIVDSRTAAAIDITAVIPADDTIPQISEGGEAISLTITPKSSSNTLLIQVVFNGQELSNLSNNMILALFASWSGHAGTDAIAAVNVQEDADSPTVTNLNVFNCYFTPGTTQTITISLRVGCSASSTINMNQEGGGGRRLGGVLYSSLTVTEYKA